MKSRQVLFMDAEFDGLNPTKMHCLCTIDGEGNQCRYSSEAGNLEDGLRALSQASAIVGHNLIAFDLAVISNLYPEFTSKAFVRDTLVCARLAWPHVRDLDWQRNSFPRDLIGSHSLKAWGMRLGFHKYEYGEDDESAWDSWSQEMEDYCMRDVEVTYRLYQEFEKQEVPEEATELEHEIHDLMLTATVRGWYFNRKEADKLYCRLLASKDQLEAELQDLFPPKTVQLKTKTKLVPFNPGSRTQIAERFKGRGWEPKEFTSEGRPKISEAILEELEAEYSEAGALKDYLLVQKRLGQLAEGANSWLGLVQDDDRIHGRFITCGATISHRMVHHSPNISQCPNLGSKFGKEMRALWTVPHGYKLVGSDLSGAELRLLAHAMAYWDDGRFARMCEDGDPHQENADKLGITRPQAKVVQFALIYGGGDQMLGEAVGGTRREGAEIRYRFYKTHPAFQKLLESMREKAKTKKYLIGLDGRKLYPRSQHSVLNLWIQNATVTVAKQAALIHCDSLSAEGILPQVDFHLLAHLHDEWQIEVKAKHADQVAELAPESIREAGRRYSLNVRLDGDTSIGTSWAETH